MCIVLAQIYRNIFKLLRQFTFFFHMKSLKFMYILWFQHISTWMLNFYQKYLIQVGSHIYCLL